MDMESAASRASSSDVFIGFGNLFDMIYKQITVRWRSINFVCTGPMKTSVCHHGIRPFLQSSPESFTVSLRIVLVTLDFNTDMPFERVFLELIGFRIPE